MAKEAQLAAIMREAEAVEPDLDFEQWRARLQSRAAWPCSTAAGEAWLGWRLLIAIGQEVAAAGDSADRPVMNLLLHAGHTKNLNDSYRNEVVPRFFEPLFDYLIERVEERSAYLYLAVRWIAQLQWFDADQLFRDFEADTQRGEEVYDRHLRQFLFTQGIDMPFSQARTPSGQTDVLASLESSEPFVGEVKLFGHGRDKAGLASGVRQAYTYADELGKNVAFLLIVNLDDRILDMPNDDSPGRQPGYVDVAGIRVYFAVANALPQERSASKRGRGTVIKVRREELLSEI